MTASSTAEPRSSTTALDLVSPDPSPVERRRRRRVLVKGVVVTFVLISAWIAVMVGLQVVSSSGYNFRAETQLILEQIRDGKADAVYYAGSPRLHETMIADAFVDIASDINQNLGGFREILAIKEVESISGPGGETRRVKVTLAFDNARVTGHVSYHLVGDTWRLLGFHLSLPDEVASTVMARKETRQARGQAPTEVYALAEAVLVQERDGQIEDIYAAASPTFQQSVDLATFRDVQAERRRMLGSYIRILDTLKSARNASRMRATVAAVVQYEQAKATVTFGFIKVDGVWKLAHYKVVMPEPRIPPPPADSPE